MVFIFNSLHYEAQFVVVANDKMAAENFTDKRHGDVELIAIFDDRADFFNALYNIWYEEQEEEWWNCGYYESGAFLEDAYGSETEFECPPFDKKAKKSAYLSWLRKMGIGYINPNLYL